MPELLTEPGGLALVDWALLALYAGATVGLGYYYSRKQSSTDEAQQAKSDSDRHHGNRGS